MPDFIVRTKKMTILETNDIDQARSAIEQHPNRFIQYNKRGVDHYMKSHISHRGERERGQTQSKKA